MEVQVRKYSCSSHARTGVISASVTNNTRLKMDNKLTQNNKTKKVVTMDLQSVLLILRTNASAFYYKKHCVLTTLQFLT